MSKKEDLLNISFYHGTTLESWKLEAAETYLFVVDEIEVAKQHGIDRVESSISNNDGNERTAIVVQINVRDIINLKWEADDDIGRWNYKTWQESWKEVGSFVVVGNFDSNNFKIVWRQTFK